MKNSAGLLTLALLSFTLAACQSLTSTEERIDTAPTVEPRVGIYYFLPKKFIQLTGQFTVDAENKRNGYSIKLSEHIRPDRDFRYFLRQGKNALFDDKSVLTTDAVGLLKTVNMTATDQTPAVIATVTETILNLAKIAAYGPDTPGFVPFLSTNKETPAKKEPVKPFDVTFDPLDVGETARAVTIIREAGFTLTPNPPAQSPKAFSGSLKLKGDASGDGVLYRPPTIATFDLSAELRSDATTSFGKIHRKFAVTVPDTRTAAVLPFRREMFVSKKLNATFTSGTVTSLNYDLPSQALGVVKIPADIVKQVAAAIPEIITIKNDNRVDPNAAVIAETARITAETDRLKAQAALEEAQKKP